MTNEYYAVIRSTDDHLAHYGIKGMRWGVRKAIARGNSEALDRHFRKAAKKLAKLQDIGLNRGKYAAKAAAYGAAAIGSGIGTAKIPNYTSKYKISYRHSKLNPIKETVPTTRTKIRKMLGLNDSTANKIGLGVGLATTAGLGAMAGVNAYRAANSRKYREKAVNFKNEMDNLFRGTKYQGKYVAQPRMPKSNTRKKRKRRM